MVGFLVFCELASGFTQGFYSPLLPDIARSTGVSDAAITWFLTVQTLSAAVCVPLLSRLGDMYGHRRVLRVAMVSVALGTVLIAVVPSYPVMLVARVLHGPIAVWLPLEIAIVHGRITGDAARRGIGLLASFLTGGAILGTVLAGVIGTHSPSLTLTLLTPLLPLALSVYAVFAKVPESPEHTPSRIDVIGFAGLALVMITLLSGLSLVSSSGIASPTTLLVLGTALALFVCWFLWERRTPSPAIDVRLATSHTVGAINLVGFVFGLVLFGAQSPLTTFLGTDPATAGYGFAASPGAISLVIATITVLMTVGAAVFASVARLIGMRRMLLAGTLLPFAATVLLIALHTAMWHVWVYAVMLGLGMGLLLGGLPALLAELAPRGQTGAAVGVYNALRTLGGATGGALFGVMLSVTTTGGDRHARLGGYQLVWVLCAIAFLIASVAVTMLRTPTSSLPRSVTPADR